MIPPKPEHSICLSLQHKISPKRKNSTCLSLQHKIPSKPKYSICQSLFDIKLSVRPGINGDITHNLKYDDTVIYNNSFHNVQLPTFSNATSFMQTTVASFDLRDLTTSTLPSTVCKS